MYGGTLGIRDIGSLDAATNQPRHIFYYGVGDVYDMAAAYAFHISEGQFFLDGNKRTAVTSALTFLGMNDVDLLPFREDDLFDILIGIAEKRFGKSDLAGYFRNPPQV